MSRGLGPAEMTRRSGLSAKALRLYQQNGLLIPAEVDPATGYRRYTAEQVARARAIGLLRRAQMPLAVIAEVLDAPAGEQPHRIRAWWREHEFGRARARHVFDRLTDTEAGAPVGHEADWSGEVSSVQLPETTVASIVRTVEQDDLVPTFTSDVLALRGYLLDCGADPEPGHWVIYRNAIAPGSPGQIETCVPYRGRPAPSGPIVLRVEPAARVIRTPVTVAQCRYPLIVAAFDAVMNAAQGAGGMSGPPREMYTGQWSEDPADVVAHVAAPGPSEATDRRD